MRGKAITADATQDESGQSAADRANTSGQTTPPLDVIVVGAGMAGLAAAQQLTRAGLRVLVLEGRDRRISYGNI